MEEQPNNNPETKVHPEQQNPVLKYRKYWYLLVGFVGSIIMAGLLYFTLPQTRSNEPQTEVNNIQEIKSATFKNEEVGYEFKYPSDWLMSKDGNGARFRLNSGQQIFEVTHFSGTKLTEVDTKKLNLSTPFDNWGSLGAKGEPTSTTIDGHKALQISSSTGTSVYIERDFDTVIEMGYLYATDATLESILSSLKFSEKTDTQATGYGDVKISDLKINLRYPNNCEPKLNNEKNRAGSYISYDFYCNFAKQKYNLQEVLFYTPGSIKQFQDNCNKSEEPCFFGYTISLEEYNNLIKALNNNTNFGDYKLVKINGQNYLKQYFSGPYGGLAYVTSVDNVLVEFWINLEYTKPYPETYQLTEAELSKYILTKIQ
jgi:hypothetical protein